MITATVGGNVGSVELKAAQDGTPILSFSVASNERGRCGQESTTWVRCSLFGKRGEALANVMTKGSSVMVSGSLTLREYEKDGAKRTSLDMRVDNLAFLGGKGNAPGADHEVAEPAATRRVGKPSGSGSTAATPGSGVAYPGIKSAGDFVIQFGRDNGKRISEVDDLTWLRGALVKSIGDPSRAEYAERNKAQVNAIDAEMEKRKGGGADEVTPAPEDGGGYGGGGYGTDDIPFASCAPDLDLRWMVGGSRREAV